MEGYPSNWAYHAITLGTHEFPASILGSTQEGDDPIYYPDDQHQPFDIHPSAHTVEGLSLHEIHHPVGDSYEEFPKGSTSFEVPSTSYDHVDTPPVDMVEALNECFRAARLQPYPRWFEDAFRGGASSSFTPLSLSSSSSIPPVMTNPFVPTHLSCSIPTTVLGMHVVRHCSRAGFISCGSVTAPCGLLRV